jgi:hypothetical protein
VSNVEAALRVLNARSAQQQKIIEQLTAAMNDLMSRPRTITEEIDQIPGRRIDTIFSGEVTFTAAADGTRGNPVLVQISQDGPFVMTHYPMVLWRPSAPDNATNFGRWRPVTTFPLPDQVVDTDIIDIMYELADGGNQRNFQNAPRGPVLSRPDNIVPLACPTLWAPNSAISLTPTYNNILFDAVEPPTAGILHVDFIGYRIVNL